ncbi:kelch domain-containing protein 3 [Drosophila subobscura]|uniref:kelch domain-containing protein 3 n=1 Tax=Drosophila subobscura TaxID=7241 RepID=UPI00155A6E57|nr:kelch domain-containing protein 3 [Drosophila subobscura]XP_034652353.1 kelch domain-containing protein 3 [Drosophila subobscura]XP_034652363.1 kelch domain-containing protein 3 [Drosophila subobscura]XP_034652374.1 kelch domain-containing protein 3 [Drosophila subobscura]
MLWTVHLDGGPQRVNHAAVGVGDLIYSFGGYCTGYDYRFNEQIDVHVLNAHTMRWTLVPQQNDDEGIPLKYPLVPFQRYGHTVVAYKERIYIWGGRNDENLCNVLYCFDPKTAKWTRPVVTGCLPGARDGHSACVIGNSMYIFGGFVDEINEFSSDVHTLNLDTMEWTYVQTFGVPPSYRDFHAAVAYEEERMYIFGGRGDKHSPYHSQEETYCHEIVFLDMKTKVWHRPFTAGKVPVGRRSHSMFVYNKLIYVFGGYNGLLDQHFNDLYTFDPRSKLWNLIRANGKAPTARRRQCAIVIGTQMFLFGGTSPRISASTATAVQQQQHQQQQQQQGEAPGPAAAAFHGHAEGQDGGPMPVLPLIDYSDLHVLDFEPTLKTLATMVVLKYQLDISGLPRSFCVDLQMLTQPNSISRPINQAG